MRQTETMNKLTWMIAIPRISYNESLPYNLSVPHCTFVTKAPAQLQLLRRQYRSVRAPLAAYITVVSLIKSRSFSNLLNTLSGLLNLLFIYNSDRAPLKLHENNIFKADHYKKLFSALYVLGEMRIFSSI